MRTEPNTTIRPKMQFLQRMREYLHSNPKKHWRIIAHIQNISDKILTFIGVSFFHLKEVNPIGKLFIEHASILYGSIVFFLFGILCIEYVWRVQPKFLRLTVFILSVVITTNTYLLIKEAL